MSLITTASRATLGAVLAAATALGASAQEDYPSQPITIVVPGPAGGGPDVAARVIGEEISQALETPVVIENRPGAAGEIAGEAVARADPDGYTLLLAFAGVITVNPHLSANIAYDTLVDLVPVAPISESQLMLVVNPSLGVETLEEFLNAAREADPVLTYSSGGVANTAFRGMESLKAAAGIDMLHVPYAGGAPASRAAVSGEVDATMSGTSAAQDVDAGNLVALASTGSRRMEDRPDLPTLAETFPGLVETAWFGIFAPAGTPGEIVDTLAQAIVENRDSERAVAAFEAAGSQYPSDMSPEEFRELIPVQHERMGQLFDELGVEPQ